MSFEIVFEITGTGTGTTSTGTGTGTPSFYHHLEISASVSFHLILLDPHLLYLPIPLHHLTFPD